MSNNWPDDYFDHYEDLDELEDDTEDQEDDEEPPPWIQLEQDLWHVARGPATRRALARAGVRFAEDPQKLVAYLRSRTVDPDEKDSVFRQLVDAAQADTKGAVDPVLLLGVWPAMTALHGRVEWRYKDRPHELVADLGTCFSLAVRSMRLERVNKVAATLVLNTGRRLRYEGRREDRYAKRYVLLGDAAGQLVPGPRNESLFDIPPGVDRASEVALLRGRLRSFVGEDADLVAAIAVEGATAVEVANLSGLSPEAVRSRYRRARAKLRKALAAYR